MTILVGADLATQSGLCFGRPHETPTTEVVRAPVTGEEYGPWGAFYWTYFNRLLDRLQAQLTEGEGIVIAYESPILPRARWSKTENKMVGGTRIETVRKLGSLGVFLESVCHLHPAPTVVKECGISEIKKELAGSGGADKASMVFVARRAGVALPEGDEAMDAADAFGAWLMAVRHYAPEHQMLWDKRLRQPTGAHEGW